MGTYSRKYKFAATPVAIIRQQSSLLQRELMHTQKGRNQKFTYKYQFIKGMSLFSVVYVIVIAT